MNTVLQINNLCKSYEGFKLDNVSFSLQQGHIMGFIGRNGAGKSTTLKSLLNLVHPDSGEICFWGNSFKENELEIKRSIGFVAGGVDYYPRVKLKTITKATRKMYGSSWDDTAYKRYMEMFSLSENKTPAQLSAGMRVKYALTLALSHNAKLLILDEPTSGLDPVSREDLLEVFLNLADKGVTVLFSTHITSDLEKCADDITYIKNGRIMASCALRDYVNQYVVAKLTAEQLQQQAVQSASLGIRRIKGGYSCLLKRTDAPVLAQDLTAATLEDIMVHMEKEAE
ncbi:MAG: ABC transporter ATP-binding protein [Ruminococcaceae bacterium]|nr:ABC transporter ATP-binding protein [Oscillospiraceae bacterium]